MKIRPMGIELYHKEGWTDGRTDERTDRNDEAIFRFAQFR